MMSCWGALPAAAGKQFQLVTVCNQLRSLFFNTQLNPGFASCYLIHYPIGAVITQLEFAAILRCGRVPRTRPLCL
jgi:hypothetical protein